MEYNRVRLQRIDFVFVDAGFGTDLGQSTFTHLIAKDLLNRIVYGSGINGI